MPDGGSGKNPAAGDELFNRPLSSDGTLTGTLNQNVNGAITPVDFYAEALADERLSIARAIVYLRDGGSFDSGGYGNGGALTNGVGIWGESAGERVDFTPGLIVKVNVDWARLCFDITPHSWGSGDQALTIRWTFAKYGKPLLLSEGDRFGVTINDDLTGLVEQTILLEGMQLGRTDPGWKVVL